MRLNHTEQNAFFALRKLLQINKVRVTNTILEQYLSQHSEFPRLISLSDVLSEIKIPNLATRIMPQQLAEIPLPAIAHFENGMGYVTVTKVFENTIEWHHDKVGINQESISKFSQKWEGVTLLAEPNELSGEDEYLLSRNKEILDVLKIPFGILILAGIFKMLFIKSLDFISVYWVVWGIQITKLIGVAICIMLIWHSLDSNNPFLKKVCQINKKSNCNNILNSSVAQLWGIISWSEIGLFYFLGSLIAFLVVPNSSFVILKVLNIVALPYTVWSIYYQGFVVKSWCPLCVTVQILLWIEFIIFQNTDVPYLLNFDWRVLFTLLITPAIWALLKNNFYQSSQFEAVNRQFENIRFSTAYLEGLISQKRLLPPIFEGMKLIELGSQNAKNTIVMVLDPFCTSCKLKYLELNTVIKVHENFKCKIIFAASNQIEDVSGRVIRAILNLPTNEERGIVLEKWFHTENRNLNLWLLNSNVTETHMEKGQEQLILHSKWLNIAGITETPTFFLNSVEMPSFFKVIEFPKILKLSSNT
jgi:uncharacterized membrane protein